MSPSELTDARTCPACDAGLAASLEEWLLRCPACDLWVSLLGEGDGRLGSETALDEQKRVAALKRLRERTSEELLDALGRHMTLSGARLLDVGCAYGWFLEAARARGVVGCGIEPEAPIAAAARAGGLDVRAGYFPECVAPTERFDAIVFNDVLEHLPRVDAVLARCREILSPDGKLLVFLPDSRGPLYRAACWFHRAGYAGPFRRLWQKDFHSPHLSYFNSANLARCAARHGFRLLTDRSLQTMSVEGLWLRIHMDGARPSLATAITFAGLVVASPILGRITPSDALLHIYARDDAG